jgi:cytochrome oxidase Cu insertion factor (SCO1/SenC/PrrC family)
MKRSLHFAVVSAALILFLVRAAPSGSVSKPPPVTPPAVGKLAPDFTLVDQNGKRVTLSAARGRKVVLVFYRGYW